MLGNYRVVRVIGRGGMGTVYEAENIVLRRKAAVKLLNHDRAGNARAVERFLQEARLAARLSHPNVVGVYDVGRYPAGHYIAMEMVGETSAADLLARHGRLGWREAARIAAAVGRGLAAAHGVGLVHRDVKPSNILRGLDGAVKLTDFGLAKALEDPSRSAAVEGRIVGTPDYISPEQAQSRPLDSRSDIYSLGATLFHLVTGRRPFADCKSWMDVILAHVSADFPDPRSVRPDIPDRLAGIILRAAARSPEDRYGTAEEMADELDRLLADLPPGPGSSDEIDPLKSSNLRWTPPALPSGAASGSVSGSAAGSMSATISATSTSSDGRSARSATTSATLSLGPGWGSTAEKGAGSPAERERGAAPPARAPASRRGRRLRVFGPTAVIAGAVALVAAALGLRGLGDGGAPAPSAPPPSTAAGSAASVGDDRGDSPEDEPPTPAAVPPTPSAVPPNRVAEEFRELAAEADAAEALGDPSAVQAAVARLRDFHRRHHLDAQARGLARHARLAALRLNGGHEVAEPPDPRLGPVWLSFWTGIHDSAQPGNGVRLIIDALEPGGRWENLFDGAITERGWTRYSVNLSDYRGRRVELRFTLDPRHEHTIGDWFCLGEPRLLRVREAAANPPAGAGAPPVPPAAVAAAKVVEETILDLTDAADIARGLVVGGREVPYDESTGGRVQFRRDPRKDEMLKCRGVVRRGLFMHPTWHDFRHDPVCFRWTADLSGE
jgi:serine/threonine protein kinase